VSMVELRELRDMLAHTIRGKRGFTGTKVACDNGARQNYTSLMRLIPPSSVQAADCDGGDE
jgi:hypothetical protein